MPNELWDFARNPYFNATTDNESLGGDLIDDGLDRLQAAGAENATLQGLVGPTQSVKATWDAADSAVHNLEAGVRGATDAFEEYISSLTKKPNNNTNSPIAVWDIAIQGQVAHGGPIYVTLLPDGRETLTTGTYQEQLDAIKDFATRLGQQAGNATLIALGVTVMAWYNAGKALRDTQNSKKALLVQARSDRAIARLLVCHRLMATIGIAISVWVETQERVETLVDLSLLRDPPQTVPGVPGPATWTAAARRLSVAELPPGATRLVAYRLGPGGAPEELATGEFRATEVIIPVSITWESGKTYQLWLTGKNSRGQSEPGPIITWTAPGV